MTKRNHFPGYFMLFLAIGWIGDCHTLAAQENPGSLATQPSQAWQRRETDYITTRDGEQLCYSVLLPKAEDAFPVIINYSGYDPGAIGGSVYREGDTAMSFSLDQLLLGQSYAVMSVNARGTGCSTGTFDFLGTQ